MKWIHYNQKLPARYAYKKDIPKCWQHWAKRVEFLFEIAWIVRDPNGLVYTPACGPDCQWTATLDFHLNTPGHVIGLRDLTTADAYDWAHEWKAAMHDRIQESIVC